MDYRKFGRTRSKGSFARIPAWIFRDSQGLLFKTLKGSEAKVLDYLCFRANNSTDETPSFTVAGLSRSVGLSRDTIRKALRVLGNLGIIALCDAKQKPKLFARILLTQPNYGNDTTATAQTAPAPDSTPFSLSGSTNGNGSASPGGDPSGLGPCPGEPGQAGAQVSLSQQQRPRQRPTATDYNTRLSARLSRPVGERAKNSPHGGEIFDTQAPRKSPVPQGLKAGEKLATSSTAGHSVSEAAPSLDLDTELGRDDPDFLAEIKRIRGEQP